jgi:hypothetical protein
VTSVVVNNLITSKARRESKGRLKNVTKIFQGWLGRTQVANLLCFMLQFCFVLLAVQVALKREVSKSASKLVILPLN